MELAERRVSVRRAIGVAVWVLVLAAGVAQSSAAPAIDPGAGNADALDDDYGTFRVVPMARKICNVNDPSQGEILAAVPVLSVTVDQRLAWVLPGRDPADPSGTNGDYRWAMQGSTTEPSVPPGLEPFGSGAVEIEAAGDNAYFTAKPVIPSTVTCSSQPNGYCEWKYDIRVAKKVNGVWKVCAKLDPRIRIRE